MSFSIKISLLSWHNSFVRKKRKKAWNATPLCLFCTLWKERNRRAFEDIELTDQAILQSFLYKFLDWIWVNVDSSSWSLLDFIDWLWCKKSGGFWWFPSLFWPFSLAYIMCNFKCTFGFLNTIAFTYIHIIKKRHINLHRNLTPFLLLKPFE